MQKGDYKMQYGYARVSTVNQSLDSQISEIKKAGVPTEKIYSDTISGLNTNRNGFNAVLKVLNPGDTLIVTKLDRLARNTREALNVINDLQDKNVLINILNLGMIDNSSVGKFMTTVLLAVAEMERDMIVNRTQEGKIYAKETNPNYKEGRRKRLQSKNKDKYRAIYEFKQQHTAQQTANAFNISIRTVFYIQSMFSEKNKKE